MKVIIDTNIIYGDFHLTGAKILNLCTSVESTGGEVFVPEIVLMESINQYRERIQDAKNKISKGLNDIKRTTRKSIPKSPITDEDVKKEIIEYDKSLHSRVRSLGITILPIPNTPHKKLLEIDLARKKPFTPTGKGYRDALIWENVKELCRTPKSLEKPSVVFVNDNYTDFCDKEYNLHDDLKEDLAGDSINADCVRVVKDVDTFINEFIKPKQKILEDIKIALNKERRYGDVDLQTEVDELVLNYLDMREFDEYDSPFGPAYESPSVVGVGEASFTVTDVRQLSEDEIIIDLVAGVECEFYFTVFRSEVIAMSSEEMPHIVNADWNKHYVQASDNAEVYLNISLIVDKAFTGIQSDDIDIITKHDAWVD